MRSSKSAFSAWLSSSISNKLKSERKVLEIALYIVALESMVTSVDVSSGTRIDSSFGTRFFLAANILVVEGFGHQLPRTMQHPWFFVRARNSLEKKWQIDYKSNMSPLYNLRRHRAWGDPHDSLPKQRKERECLMYISCSSSIVYY